MKSKSSISYTSERGDIIWMDFNPAMGHEQKGKRPALVLSSGAYNAKTGMILVCPITSQSKKYPFEVAFSTQSISGYILVDQIRSFDWKARKMTFVTKIDELSLMTVSHKIQQILLA